MSEVDPSEVPSTPSPKKPEREGLPSGYRMRADAHYVDQLTSRRSDMAPQEPPRIVKRAEPPDADPIEPRDRRDARDRRLERVLAQLVQDVGAIGSSAGLLSDAGSDMARRANVEVVRAHAWRASWLLRANAILDGTHRGQLRPRSLAALMAGVQDGCGPELRLAGANLQTCIPDSAALVVMDEVAMSAAITGGVFASLGLLPDLQGSTIRVSAASMGTELRTVEISQDEIQVPAAVSSFFFDQSWTDRPGGWLAGMGAACVKAAAGLYGGDVVFMAGARRGSTIRVNLHRPIDERRS